MVPQIIDPGCRVVRREIPRIGRGPYIARQPEDLVGLAEIPKDRREPGDVPDGETRAVADPTDLPSDRGVADHLAAGVFDEGLAEAKSVCCYHQRPPVRLGQHCAPTRPQDSSHFGEHSSRITHVLQGAVDTQPIDGTRRKRQVMGVRANEVRSSLQPPSPEGGGQHPGIEVDTDDQAGPAYRIPYLEQVRAGTAADVHHGELGGERQLL